MEIHPNARTCPRSRALLVDRVIQQRWSVMAAAGAAGCSSRTAYKWLRRFREEGADGLLDRSSVAHHIPTRTAEDRVQAIAALRGVRMTGLEISEILEMPLSTVSAILTRTGLGSLRRLEPPEPAVRYQRAEPGELLHIDVKRLGRFDRPGQRVTGDHTNRRPRRIKGKKQTGYEYVHVCVDDATRLAYAEVLVDEKATTAVGFLRRALAFYRRYGIHIQAVMTDNAPSYLAIAHTTACRLLGIRHIRTRPYRPQTNGKAERFIRTLLGGWAYGALYTTSTQRTHALPGWLHHYNHRRPHGSLNRQTPYQRLQLVRNNGPGPNN